MRGWLMRWFPLATRAGRAFGERFTPLGKWLLASCLISGIFSADPTRTHAFLLFGATSALLIVAFVASLLWRPRVQVRRELPPAACAGHAGEYVVELHNAGRRALSAVRVADRLQLRYPTRAEFDAEIADAPEDNWFDRRVGFLRWQRLRQRLQGATLATVTLPALAAGASTRVSLTLEPLRRGWLQFDALRLLQPEPLGLCYAVLTVPLLDRVLSRPPLVPVPLLDMHAAQARPHLQGGAQRRGDGREFFALRDYRPGDPPRHIDWRVTARRGQPIVRQFAAEALPLPRVIVDTCAARRTPADFEAMLSIAASVLVAAGPRGSSIILQVLDGDGRAPCYPSIGEALDALAVLAPAAGDTLPAYASAALAPGAAPVILICAHWDAQRAAAWAQVAARCAMLGLSTDPLAAGAPQVLFISDPARELPVLCWPPPPWQAAS